MTGATLREQMVRKRMSELQLWRDEKFIGSDELLLRIVRHLDHDVRRDIVGWMKAPGVTAPDRHSSFRATILEYVRGAAQVIDIFPDADAIPALSDHAQLALDAEAVSEETRAVAIFARSMLERRGKAVGE